MNSIAKVALINIGKKNCEGISDFVFEEIEMSKATARSSIAAFDICIYGIAQKESSLNEHLDLLKEIHHAGTDVLLLVDSTYNSHQFSLLLKYARDYLYRDKSKTELAFRLKKMIADKRTEKENIGLKKRLAVTGEKVEHCISETIGGLPVAIAIRKQDKVLIANDLWKDYFKVSKSENLVGKDFKEAFGVMKDNLYGKFDFNPFFQNQTRLIKLTIPNKFSKKFLLNISESNFMRAGSVLYSIIDLTELEKLKNKHLETEQKYEQIIDLMNDAVFMINRSGNIKYVNKQQEKLFGRTLEEVINKNFLSFVPRKEISRYLKRLKGIFLNRKIEHFETYIYHKSGKMIPVEINGRLAIVNKEKVGIGTVKDISSHKAEEQEKKELHRAVLQTKILLRKVIDTSKDLFAVIDNEDKFLLTNKAFADIFSVKVQELKNKNRPTKLGTKQKEFWQIFKKTISSAKKSRTKIPVEIPEVVSLKLQGKETVSYKISAVKIIKKGYSLPLYLFYGQNITEIVEKQEALKRANLQLEELIHAKNQKLKLTERNFRLLFENSHDSIIINNLKGEILDCNERICNEMEYPRNVLLSKNIKLLLPETGASLYGKQKTELKRKGFTLYETELVSKNGKRVPVEVSSSMIDNPEGVLILSIYRNISERKNIRQKILKAILNTEEAERKRFAQDLHDGLGALLSGVKMNIDLMTEMKHDEKTQDSLLSNAQELINESANSIREIADNIKPHILTNFGLVKSLNTLIERFSELKNIDFELHAEKYRNNLNEEAELSVYRIISELINNTLKHSGADKVVINIQSNDTDKVLLHYSDNGMGFSPDTRITGKGNGLLNIETRVGAMQGSIEVQSEVGEGVDFLIKLPTK